MPPPPHVQYVNRSAGPGGLGPAFPGRGSMAEGAGIKRHRSPDLYAREEAYGDERETGGRHVRSRSRSPSMDHSPPAGRGDAPYHPSAVAPRRPRGTVVLPGGRISYAGDLQTGPESDAATFSQQHRPDPQDHRRLPPHPNGRYPHGQNGDVRLARGGSGGLTGRSAGRADAAHLEYRGPHGGAMPNGTYSNRRPGSHGGPASTGPPGTGLSGGRDWYGPVRGEEPSPSEGRVYDGPDSPGSSGAARAKVEEGADREASPHGAMLPAALRRTGSEAAADRHVGGSRGSGGGYVGPGPASARERYRADAAPRSPKEGGSPKGGGGLGTRLKPESLGPDPAAGAASSLEHSNGEGMAGAREAREHARGPPCSKGDPDQPPVHLGALPRSGSLQEPDYAAAEPPPAATHAGGAMEEAGPPAGAANPPQPDMPPHPLSELLAHPQLAAAMALGQWGPFGGILPPGAGWPPHLAAELMARGLADPGKAPGGAPPERAPAGAASVAAAAQQQQQQQALKAAAAAGGPSSAAALAALAGMHPGGIEYLRMLQTAAASGAPGVALGAHALGLPPVLASLVAGAAREQGAHVQSPGARVRTGADMPFKRCAQHVYIAHLIARRQQQCQGQEQAQAGTRGELEARAAKGHGDGGDGARECPVDRPMAEAPAAEAPARDVRSKGIGKGDSPEGQPPRSPSGTPSPACDTPNGGGEAPPPRPRPPSPAATAATAAAAASAELPATSGGGSGSRTVVIGAAVRPEDGTRSGGDAVPALQSHGSLRQQAVPCGNAPQLQGSPPALPPAAAAPAALPHSLLPPAGFPLPPPLAMMAAAAAAGGQLPPVPHPQAAAVAAAAAAAAAGGPLGLARGAPVGPPPPPTASAGALGVPGLGSLRPMDQLAILNGMAMQRGLLAPYLAVADPNNSGAAAAAAAAAAHGAFPPAVATQAAAALGVAGPLAAQRLAPFFAGGLPPHFAAPGALAVGPGGPLQQHIAQSALATQTALAHSAYQQAAVAAAWRQQQQQQQQQ